MFDGIVNPEIFDPDGDVRGVRSWFWDIAWGCDDRWIWEIIGSKQEN